MKLLIMYILPVVLITLFTGCLSEPVADEVQVNISESDSLKLTAEKINNFLQANKTTSNEYETVKSANERFAEGVVFSEDGLEAMEPFLRKESKTEKKYFVVLINNPGIVISGDVVVDKKTGQVLNSRFIAKKFNIKTTE